MLLERTAVEAAGECRLVVAEDRLRADVMPMTGFGAADVSVDHIAARMKELGLEMSPVVRAELMKRAAGGRLWVEEPVCVAAGTPPVDEVAGRLEAIVEEPAEKVDHYHRSRIRT